MPQSIVYGLPLKQRIRVGPATIAYLEEGDDSAPPALFLHGLTTNAALWQKVMKRLHGHVHSFAIDLMGLGDTEVSPYEDFTMPAQAEMVTDLLDRLGLDRVMLVAHDHGGAVAQIVAANHPERVSHLVLVDTVAGDHWPISLPRPAIPVAPRPGAAALLRGAARVHRSEIARRLATGPVGFALGYANPDLLDPRLVREYLRPFTDPDGRERARRFLLSGDTRSTVEILPRLRRFDRPCRILWGADDKFLSPSWGMQLADEIPSASFHLIPFCGHFAPDERPEVVTRHVLHVLTGAP